MYTSPTLRQPTTRATSLAWWRKAVQYDGDLPRHDGWPECGWYQVRMVKGGPAVPVVISLGQITDDDGALIEPERMICLVSGVPENPARLWTHLQPISREAFSALSARAHKIDPKQKLNLMKAPRGPND